MKPISERQIEAIRKLARATKTEVSDIEQMSSYEASQLISGLVEKMNQQKGTVFSDAGRKKGSSYSSDALAGLAVKILAQKRKVEDIIGKADSFKQKAVELYKVFDSARQACLA